MSTITTIIALALSAAAHAGEGERMLHAFLSDVTTLEARFTQTLVDDERRIRRESGGTLAVSRPDRFRWDYLEPDRQVIVADGEYLWMYDADLGQVTVRELDHTLASTPAMLLTGDGEFDGEFSVEELGTVGGMTWIRLSPRLDDTDFEAVRIGFADGVLAVMELVDGFGQTTRIEFDDLVINPEIEPAVFEFEPPEGADVIGPGGV